jgi:hypothetical protein
MDLIYTSAVLTLIAAAGNDPSYGLPGVSNARKMRYRDAAIGSVCVSFVPDAVYRVVADSRWFTRGGHSRKATFREEDYTLQRVGSYSFATRHKNTKAFSVVYLDRISLYSKVP